MNGRKEMRRERGGKLSGFGLKMDDFLVDILLQKTQLVHPFPLNFKERHLFYHNLAPPHFFLGRIMGALCFKRPVEGK